MSDDAAPAPIGPWTVKGMPQEDRDAINAAAKRADQTVGEWLKGAARLAIQVERQGMPAGMPERMTSPEAGKPEASPPVMTGGAVDVVERLAAVLPSLTRDARGGGRLASLARKVIEQHLRTLLLDDGPPSGPPRITAGRADNAEDAG